MLPGIVVAGQGRGPGEEQRELRCTIEIIRLLDLLTEFNSARQETSSLSL